MLEKSALLCQAIAMSQLHVKLEAYKKLVLNTSKKLRQDVEVVANLARRRGLKAGFLATKVMPVDGFKIRNSLFLSVRRRLTCSILGS